MKLFNVITAFFKMVFAFVMFILIPITYLIEWFGAALDIVLDVALDEEDEEDQAGTVPLGSSLFDYYSTENVYSLKHYNKPQNILHLDD